MTKDNNIFLDFFRLFYPKYCACCGNVLVTSEDVLCLKCIENLPKTNFHLQTNNPVEEKLMGRVKFERATAFCFFKKEGSIQHLIHELKYKNYKQIGIKLGYLMGCNIIGDPTFNSIDVIVPIPIHPKKQQKRGYNQSEQIGIGLQQAMNKPLDTSSFVRIYQTDTQTKKSRYERWKNVEEIFKVVNPEMLQNKHILLIDDVITTGATLESAANCLLQTAGTKISIACLATAT